MIIIERENQGLKTAIQFYTSVDESVLSLRYAFHWGTEAIFDADSIRSKLFLNINLIILFVVFVFCIVFCCIVCVNT